MSDNPHTRSQAAYDAASTTRFGLKLNDRYDGDIIRWLRQQPSIQGYIKQIIREDMARRMRHGTDDQQPDGAEQR